MDNHIPPPVIACVAPILGDRYKREELERFFMAAEAPEFHGGATKSEFVTKMLQYCNKSLGTDALRILGSVLEDFMSSTNSYREKDREEIKAILEKFDLRYSDGMVHKIDVDLSIRFLKKKVDELNFHTVAEEIERAMRNANSDPKASITAAVALIEALCSQVLEENNVTLPPKKDRTVRLLWGMASGQLEINPESTDDKDAKKLLGALVTIVQELSPIRNDYGSAHGRPKKKRVPPKYARLATMAAYTLALFVLETFDEQKRQ